MTAHESAWRQPRPAWFAQRFPRGVAWPHPFVWVDSRMRRVFESYGSRGVRKANALPCQSALRTVRHSMRLSVVCSCLLTAPFLCERCEKIGFCGSSQTFLPRARQISLCTHTPPHTAPHTQDGIQESYRGQHRRASRRTRPSQETKENVRAACPLRATLASPPLGPTVCAICCLSSHVRTPRTPERRDPMEG